METKECQICLVYSETMPLTMECSTCKQSCCLRCKIECKQICPWCRTTLNVNQLLTPEIIQWIYNYALYQDMKNTLEAQKFLLIQQVGFVDDVSSLFTLAESLWVPYSELDPSLQLKILCILKEYMYNFFLEEQYIPPTVLLQYYVYSRFAENADVYTHFLYEEYNRLLTQQDQAEFLCMIKNIQHKIYTKNIY